MEVKYPLKLVSKYKKLNKNTNLRRSSKTKCLSCNKDTQKSFFPFCSKKCSDIDLIKWLSDEDNNG